MKPFEGFPFVIGWEFTLECNLRCNHCGSSAGLPRDAELSTNECIKICDEFPALLVQEVNFTGGEPLLRSDLFEILSYLKQLEIPSKILSHGLSLTDKNIDRLTKAGVVGIGVSIDGCEATHDHIRGRKGMYKEILANTKAAIDAGLDITVITTANTLNIGELKDLREILAQIGVSRWQVQPIFKLGRTRNTGGLALNPTEYKILGIFGRSCLQEENTQGMEILFGDSYGYYTQFDTREPEWGGCPAGLLSCGITSNGMIKGCLSLPDNFVEGDLRKNDLWDIWFNPESFRYNRSFTTADMGENCRDCQKAEQCRGGCTAMSYGYTEKLHNDPLCFTLLEKQKDSS